MLVRYLYFLLLDGDSCYTGIIGLVHFKNDPCYKRQSDIPEHLTTIDISIGNDAILASL